MMATYKITYSAADGQPVPAHYVQVTARNSAEWDRKAAKAARTAALRDETVVAIARGDDRAYSGVRPRIESATRGSQPPMRGLTPADRPPSHATG
jgi:hypothetical protein